MQCGVSTSCLYPMDTRESLQTLQNCGVNRAEIFLNTFSELEDGYVQELCRLVRENGTSILAMHPFTSGMETFFFASLYKARVEDGVRLYRRYFEICRALGAKKLVFHGDYKQTPFSFKKHCENYSLLRKIGREEYGVEFCQENVARCKCGAPHYLEMMRDYTADDVSFVLDVKQARRAGAELPRILKAMEGKISHLHLSDKTEVCDCALPGTGDFSFEELFQALQNQKFAGDMMVELYRGDFKEPQQLKTAAEYVDKIYAGVKSAAQV